LNELDQAHSRLQQLLWNAYFKNNWDEAIEDIKLQMKVICDLGEKEHKWWEDYNEPVK